MKVIAGQLNAEGMKFGIIAARFNEFVTKNLIEGALDALQRHGASENNITLVWVPGSFEIPLAAKHMALSNQYDAIICLGVVIRGATAHFDYVAGQSAAGIAKVAQESGIPVLFGILTTDTIEQALERAGTKAGNKGYDAAVSAIEMADLVSKIQKGKEKGSK